MKTTFYLYLYLYLYFYFYFYFGSDSCSGAGFHLGLDFGGAIFSGFGATTLNRPYTI